MNKQIRHLGIFLTICYLALFVKLNQVQVFGADELNNHPENARVIQREYNRPRGVITSADGALLAQSVHVEGKSFDRQRTYPEADLFGQVTGYYSFVYGATGVEKTYDDELAGATFQQQLNGIADMFVDKENVGNVQLTLRKDLQVAARDALGPREGSIVALDPRTGEILAFWSYPSYDPNLLSDLDTDATKINWDALNAAPGKPLQAHQYQERYFPGSTFKVVTSGVGLQSGKVTPDDPVYPSAQKYLPPQTTRPIFNFGGETCGGALFEILAVSCNSAFAKMGTETIGPAAMIDGAQAFGFNSRPPIDLPAPAASSFPTDFTDNLPILAQSSIGQNEVQATPLQMALVAAGVANKGVIMKPHVLSQITDSEGRVVKKYEPEQWLQPMSAPAAATLREAMKGVVTKGTGVPAQVPGVEVAGKTGTAQLGDGKKVHTWMVAFAGPPGGDPEVAVSVVVLNQPASNEFTGGQVAGPIAAKMMKATLDARRADSGTPIVVPPTTRAPSVSGAGNGTGAGAGTGAGDGATPPSTPTTRRNDAAVPTTSSITTVPAGPPGTTH